MDRFDQKSKKYKTAMAKTSNTLPKSDLNENLRKLEAISQWFEDQEEVDIEEGIKKVKEAAGLIKSSKERLRKIENEFEEIKVEIKKEVDIKEDDDKDKDEEESPF